MVRQPAKAFTLQDLLGRTLRSQDLQGKVVVMDFWATWCGPCIRELPDIQALTERLKARRDVAFLSFNVTEEKPDVLAFVNERSIAYPVYLADDLIGPYDVSAFPTKLVIDMRGKGEGIGALPARRLHRGPEHRGAHPGAARGGQGGDRRFGDEPTLNEEDGLMEEHEKMAWMLRSYLG